MSNYWKERQEKEMLERAKDDLKLNKELVKLYNYHFKEIEKEILAFQQKYMSEEFISKSQLKTLVNSLDIESFREKVKIYVREKNFSEKANKELKLYNLKMKLNRLELLQYYINLEIIALLNSEEQLAIKYFDERYVKELELQAGILSEIVKKPKEINITAQEILKRPFYNISWSENIWGKHTILNSIVKNAVEDLLIRGRNPTVAIGKIKKSFDVSRYEARRLLVTEGARLQIEIQKESYLKNDIKKFIYLSEPTACPNCLKLNDEIFDVENLQIGENAPPMHPHCFCSTSPYVDDRN